MFVDDILIAPKSADVRAKLVEDMRASFQLSAMDDAHYFLGMKIERERMSRKLFVSQVAYVDKILNRFKMRNSYAKIPMEHGCQHLTATDNEINAAQDLPYRELIGSLMYLACTSRPDIMYATGHMARSVSCYSQQHWNSAKKIAKYV